MWTDLTNKKIDDLKDFGGIYIGGGNTYKLLDNIYSSNFDEVLGEYYSKGGLIYGGSAGAIILGKTISIVTEENVANYTYEDGLNLLNGRSVICHYNEEKKAPLSMFIENNKTDIIVLTEKSGVIVSNINQIESVGFESVKLFSYSKEAKNLEPGESTTI